MTLSALHAESGQANVNVQGAQRLDNLYVAAQLGAQAAQGATVAVAGGAQAAAWRDSIRRDAAPGTTTTLFDSGKFDGPSIYAAARRNEVREVFTHLLRTDEAVATGSTGVAVSGLVAYPGLARDTVLLTLLNEPTAFNNAIERLKSLDASTRGDDYGELVDALQDARKYAKRYKTSGKESDLKEAVQQLGGFFADMDANHGERSGKLRENAWNAFLGAVGKDRNGSLWLVNTVLQDAGLTQGVLKAIPGIVQTADGMRIGHGAPTGNTEATYESRFFELPKDTQGRVESTGWFGLGKDNIAVQMGAIRAALAEQGVAAAGTAALATDASVASSSQTGQNLLASGVTASGLASALNINPVFYTGPLSGQPVSAVLAKQLEQTGMLLPVGVASYQALAETAIGNGMAQVKTSANDLTITLSNPSMQETLDQGGNLSAASGISAWWALLFVRFGGGAKHADPLTNDGVVPGCCTVPRPMPPTPPGLG